MDVLGEDGAPRFLRTADFLSRPQALRAHQVARLHHEIVVKPNHDVIGEIFLGTPDQVFLIESVQDNPVSICMDNQVVITDQGGRAKVIVHNGSQSLELLVLDSILGVAIPCPTAPQSEAVCGIHNQQKPLLSESKVDCKKKRQRADDLFVELGLHENKKLIGNSDARNRLWEALYQYGDVFASSDANIGRTQDEEFSINLKESSTY